MVKRPSLSGNVAKPTDHTAAATEAAKVAGALTRKAAPAAPLDDGSDMETVSYFLPLELVELCRDLAEARVKRDRVERREIVKRRKAALKAGQAVPAEPPAPARRSASAVIREALEAHRAAIEAEIEDLK
ncbi:hypothetical protein [Loktanella sp. M215]|uniref:hypothetical protein n=1 Tax=Loktanella sp. M215 TaxID=2675431 RepID=UPI001F3A2FDE|nr:hypothetical protein [Loktanella sp. M215]MCF7700928.1 hypothetical protein [Loktanella sp. M215]